MVVMTSRSDVSFVSGGRRCAGWLYLPAGSAGRVPCVVMAHGTTGTMDLGLAGYAQRFAAAGFAVLLFDYRHFGASEGRPRQLVKVGRQVADWRAAVRFARTLPRIDPDRIALWGTSLSAGHVVTVAARDAKIAAVVAQLPFMGVDTRHASPRSGRVTRALFAAAIRDAIGGLIGRPPVMVPMVGEPGAVAVFPGGEDYAVARTLAASAPRWRNEMAARSLFSLMRYRPGRLAGHLAVPLLVCVADGDTAASLRLAIRAAEQAPLGRLRRYPGGHFGAYLGDVFAQMVADQVAFLQRYLAPAPTAAGTG
jgi:dienelactone hydrolase